MVKVTFVDPIELVDTNMYVPRSLRLMSRTMTSLPDTVRVAGTLSVLLG